MSIVAHSHPFIVGVDTHARNHVYSILEASNGALLDTESFPTTAAGINRTIKWVVCRTGADADTLWVIEGAVSYGAIFAGTVAAPWRHTDSRSPRHLAWTLRRTAGSANPMP